MDDKILKLENGAAVVCAPLKERRSVSIGVWVGVGGRDEPVQLNGISHFLEHIVFKGTPTRTANQIKESVEGVGGSLNAFTAEEYTCFLAKASRKHFEKVFGVLSDMVLNASLDPKDIEKERTVIMEEIKMTLDQPSQLVDELLSEIVWPEHALGRPLAGTLGSVGGLTAGDLRNYRDRFYRPHGLTIAAAGDITESDLLEAARAFFPSQMNGTDRRTLDLFGNSQRKPNIKIFEKSTEQMHLALAVHAFSKDHPDEYILELLSLILGGNMSSRLYNEVREERGLAYDIGSFIRRYHETGAFVVTAGVDHKKSQEALSVIVQQLERMCSEPVSADELRRAKDFYLGQLDLGLENSMNRMLWIGESVVTLGRCRKPEEVMAGIEKVTAEDLCRVAQGIFKTGSLNLAVVGSAASPRNFEKVLAFSR